MVSSTARASLPPWAIDPVRDGRSTVLVVDDNRLGAKHIATLIEELGQEALVVHSWTDALRVFATKKLDLILMDAVMPTVDGFKLTRILRERASSYVPILFLTALSDQDARRRSIEAGADDLLTKPVDPIELRVRLTAMLRVRRLTRALEEKGAELERLATVDTLTNLRNRRDLETHLRQEVARAGRYERDLSLIMLDIDHFKRINDEHGHAAGDDVLRCIGMVLQTCIRVCDYAYRYGGEEFLVLAPETSAEEARSFGERVRREFREWSATASPAGSQTISVGVAMLGDVGSDDNGDALRAAADLALYAAKRGGRDRVCVWTPSLEDVAAGDSGLRPEVEKAPGEKSK